MTIEAAIGTSLGKIVKVRDMQEFLEDLEVVFFADTPFKLAGENQLLTFVESFTACAIKRRRYRNGRRRMIRSDYAPT